MGICAQCSTAIQRLRPQDWPDVPSTELKISVTLPRYCHATILDCWICVKFSEWLDVMDDKTFEDWRKQALQVEYSGASRICIEGPSDSVLPFVISICHSGYYEDGGCLIELNFVSSQAHEIMVSGRSRSSSVDLDLIRRWFDRCTRHHGKCRENRKSWFPTRLLDLKSRGRQIRLIITKDNPPNGPYMTLSHRWTKERYTKLQSSTVTQLQQAIDVVRLPKTFQDAVRIGRHLGIHYLWIDSLCIKQDEDLSDWLEESQRMGEVYSFACLNVSATRSFDGSECLLGRSSWASKVPGQIELDMHGSLQKYYAFDGDLWDDEIESGSLLRRGWVFQERYLAHRIIHFGESQLGWECLESRGLEMFPNGLPPSLGVPEAKTSDCTPVRSTSSSSTCFPDTHFAEEWQGLMSQYSKCDLTYSKDKLIALEGVVKIKMMSRPEDTYAAAMWKSTALYDLPWWRDNKDCMQFPVNTTSSRAPSWSWACVDGEINFPLSTGIFSRVQECYAHVKELTGLTMDPNGNIDDKGKIQIEGLYLLLRIQWQENEHPKGFSILGFEFSTNKALRLKSTIHLESPMEVVSPLSNSGKLLLLPLFATTRTLFCIILATTHEIGAHQRIGAIEIDVMILSTLTPAERNDERFFIEATSQTSTMFRGDILENQANIWSRTAVKLIHYLRGQRIHSRLNTIL